MYTAGFLEEAVIIATVLLIIGVGMPNEIYSGLHQILV